jgi:hypothetical protein
MSEIFMKGVEDNEFSTMTKADEIIKTAKTIMRKRNLARVKELKAKYKLKK